MCVCVSLSVAFFSVNHGAMCDKQRQNNNDNESNHCFEYVKRVSNEFVNLQQWHAKKTNHYERQTFCCLLPSLEDLSDFFLYETTKWSKESTSVKKKDCVCVSTFPTVIHLVIHNDGARLKTSFGFCWGCRRRCCWRHWWHGFAILLPLSTSACVCVRARVFQNIYFFVW